MLPFVPRIILSLFLLNFAACTSWQATQQPLRELEGKRVRLTTSDSTQLTGTLIDADSAGIAFLYQRYPHKTWISVDTSLIKGIENRAINDNKTVPLVVACFVVFLLIGYLGNLDFGWSGGTFGGD